MSDPKNSTDADDSGLGQLFRELESAVEKISDLAEEGKSWSNTTTLGSEDSGLQGVFDLNIRTGDDARRSDSFGGHPRTPSPSARHTATDQSADDASTGREVPVEERREPETDVFDEGDHVLVVAEMPGVAADQVSLDLEGDVLSIEARTGDRTYATEVLLPQEASSPTDVQANNGIVKILCSV